MQPGKGKGRSTRVRPSMRRGAWKEGKESEGSKKAGAAGDNECGEGREETEEGSNVVRITGSSSTQQ